MSLKKLDKIFNFINVKPQFVFLKKEQIGVLFLIFVIVLLQFLYFFSDEYSQDISSVETEKLIIFQEEIDSLSRVNQANKSIHYKFNPNYITDYKGYLLGMTVGQIDRLHKFRSENKFINSVEEFQAVTKVSDSLLKQISKNFQFPSWVINNAKQDFRENKYNNDLNIASVNVISRVSGVSYKLVSRVVSFRSSLNGFVSLNQLYDVYGLSKIDVKRITSKFRIKSRPKIKKININFALATELDDLVYINSYLAANILDERVLRGGFKSLDDLKYVKDFPLDRLESIKLYLTIN